MMIRTKSVEQGDFKGVVIDAESLLDLHQWLEKTEFVSRDQRAGAKAIIDFLEEAYRKI